MIAYCGEVCTTCSAYAATRSGDPAALQRVADEWNARDGTSLVAEDCVRGARLRHSARPGELRPLRRLWLREAGRVL